MHEEPCDVGTVGSLLGDPTARTILVRTSQQAMTATTLTDHCDVSQPTVYRRLDELRDCDLLVERTRPDPEGGHHRTVYATNVRRVTVELDDGRIELSIDRQEDMADRFTRLVEGM